MMHRLLNATLLGAALIATVAMAPTALRADDHNNNFAKVKESDQQAYWGWRHEHSDTELKIVIH